MTATCPAGGDGPLGLSGFEFLEFASYTVAWP
jgi:hypothetical protein